MTRRVGAALQPTALDRAIGYLAPRRALARMRARATMALVSGLGTSWGESGYVGGRHDRRSMREWSPRAGSATSDQLPGLDTLRARSRDMVRNAPLAGGAISTTVTNVVGPGLKLQARPDRAVLGLDDAEAEAWEGRAELIWRTWAQAEFCDLTGEQSFAGLQDLAFRAVLESGDILVLRRFVDDGLFSTRIQFVEADRISNPQFQMDRPELAAGVEIDGRGRSVAYHVQNAHPGDIMFGSLFSLQEWTRVPVRGPASGERLSYLLYRRLRPGQRRGVPYLAPVMEPLKQLDRYSEAEIMAAVVSAMFTVFIKSESGDGLAPTPGQEVEDPYSSEADYKLGSGSIVDLLEGESIETANPGRPNQAFDPFVTSILRQVGVGLELPFEVLIKHFTASYSAARSALLEAWKFYQARREWLAESLCQPVYAWVISEAVARGMIDAPGYFDDPVIRQAWLGSEWIGPAKGQIDPLKEIKAAKERIAIGVSTHAEETAAITGGDWERKHRQLAKERRMRIEDGLEQENAVSAGEVGPAPEDDPDEDDRREQAA